MPKLRLRAHFLLARLRAHLLPARPLQHLAWARLLSWALAVFGFLAGTPATARGRGTTDYYGGQSFEGMPEALGANSYGSNGGIPIYIENQPLNEEDFFENLDAFLDADRNLNDLQQNYLRALIPFDTYSTFYVHARDTHQVRSFSYASEMRLRKAMARNLRNYLLIKGLPKFLSSRETTKGIGDSYNSVVGQTQALTRVSIKNKETRTEFGLGFNPLVGRGWVRWGKAGYMFEASTFVFRDHSTVIAGRKKFREFTLGATYHVERKIIEPYYFEELSKRFNYQVGMIIPTKEPDPLYALTNYVRFSYSF